MRLVLSPREGLNAAACDRLLARLTGDSAARQPELVIDLQAATFIDPYSAGCLCLISQTVAGRGQRLQVVLPSTPRVQAAVVQLGLLPALRLWAEVHNLPGPEARDHAQGALPLSLIRSRADVQAVLAYLVSLAQQRLGFEDSDVLDATKVVSELCHNVVDHSQAEGWVAAQVAHDRQGRRYVALAVVDSGVGIRASLSRRHAEAAHWRHGEAIQRALGGLSSRATGGGAGLRSIDAVVRRYGGRLTIRSGDERLYLDAASPAKILSGAAFAGTQVGISFSQR